MTHDKARRILRSETDPFLRHDAHKVLSTPEPLPVGTTSGEPHWSAWNAWCDSRIRAALIEQKKFLLATVGEALGQYVAEQRKAAKRELADELRQLRIELAETQTTISELRSVLAADRSTPLDLPRLRPRN